jgi:hypothetical protein
LGNFIFDGNNHYLAYLMAKGMNAMLKSEETKYLD